MYTLNYGQSFSPPGSHWFQSLSMYLPTFYVFIYLSVCLSVYPSIHLILSYSTTVLQLLHSTDTVVLHSWSVPLNAGGKPQHFKPQSSPNSNLFKERSCQVHVTVFTMSMFPCYLLNTVNLSNIYSYEMYDLNILSNK